MNRIFIDLEMHPIKGEYKEQRAIWKTETMEIGAVKLNEDLEEIDCFREYVKPDYSDVVLRKYQRLTGITTQMLADAEKFETVLGHFCDWCGEDYMIYSWSDSDIWQVMEECRIKNINVGEKLRFMLNHWKDFQVEFKELLEMEHVISLDKAVTLGGLDFVGKAHDGLTDARNTANLYRQTKDRESKEFERLRKNLLEFNKPCTYSLGEMFNFSALDIK